MSFSIIVCDQRSIEWRQARAGRVTGTCADPLLSKGRKVGEESYQRRDLRVRLVCERLTGIPAEDGYSNRAMEWGVEKETEALAAYEAATGNLVRRTGFIAHDTLPIGCSLDGDIDNCTGLLSIKCPKSATHLGYLREPVIPEEYIRQSMHEMFCTDAQWTDWASFDPRFPSELQLVIRRIRRQDVDLKAYELALNLFLSEVDKELSAVQRLMQKAVA